MSLLSQVKQSGRVWTRKVIAKGITQTAPGSIKYLLFGPRPSQQSISIKFGKLGELLSMEIIKGLPHLELLQCGIRCIDEVSKKNKDFDLVWADHEKKIIGYRELKGNIEMDSEKIPATIEKVKELAMTLGLPGYSIDSGILNWSVYDREILTKGKSNIKKCEENGIKVEHMGDFLKTINFVWEKKDFYDYMKDLGSMVEKGLFGLGHREEEDLVKCDHCEFKGKPHEEIYFQDGGNIKTCAEHFQSSWTECDCCHQRLKAKWFPADKDYLKLTTAFTRNTCFNCIECYAHVPAQHLL